MQMDLFSEREAWNIFRLAAISEAIGWTLLITGILLKQYAFHGNNAPVDIAGQIHGTIFLAYLGAVIAVFGSLRWSKRKLLIAALASIPPYGTLVFEQWAAHKRRQQIAKDNRQIIVRAIIVTGKKLLIVQPRDANFWCLPGGKVLENEDSEAALVRILTTQTGIIPQLQGLRYMYQYKHKGAERIEFFFIIANSKEYELLDIQQLRQGTKEYDEIMYVNPAITADLRPLFLQKNDFMKQVTAKDAAVTIVHQEV
jgi:integral membrane protein